MKAFRASSEDYPIQPPDDNDANRAFINKLVKDLPKRHPLEYIEFGCGYDGEDDEGEKMEREGWDKPYDPDTSVGIQYGWTKMGKKWVESKWGRDIVPFEE